MIDIALWVTAVIVSLIGIESTDPGVSLVCLVLSISLLAVVLL